MTRTPHHVSRTTYHVSRVASYVLRITIFTAPLLSSSAQSPTFNVLNYGARGDGSHNDTAAVQKAIDTCARHGGGRVLLPSGKTFLTGALVLHDNIQLYLDNGAVLKASPHWSHFGQPGALLFAKNARAISISGNGVIDGNDHALWQQLANEEAGGDVNRPGWWPQAFTGDWWPFGKKPDEPQKGGGRPRMILFIGCERVRLHDITISNAPSWTVHLAGCQDVAVESISIHNDWNVANNDGIDLDHCRDTRIANCYLECADDTIVIKNTPNFAEYGGSARITVTGCVLLSRSSALKIDEVYTQPGAREIIFANCVVARSNRGLSIQSLDEGDIENVLFANITVQTEFSPHKWWGAAEPIHVSHFPRTTSTKLGRVRNIRFLNILCHGENGVFLLGWTNSPLQNIVLNGVHLEIAKTTTVPGGFYDERPSGLYQGVFQSRLAAVYARHVQNLELAHVDANWGLPSDPAYGPGFDQAEIENLSLDHVSLEPAPPAGLPAHTDHLP